MTGCDPTIYALLEYRMEYGFWHRLHTWPAEAERSMPIPVAEPG
jgi:hypothetical protein